MAEKKYIGKPGKQDDPCWKGYEMVGMKKKGGRQVPNCVPEATDIIAKAKAAVAKKAGAKLKMDPDTGTPDHFTAAQRRKKGLEEAYGMWKVDFPKQHAGKAVAAGSVHVKAQNTAHAHKVAAKRVGVDHKMFKSKVTKSSVLPEETKPDYSEAGDAERIRKRQEGDQKTRDAEKAFEKRAKSIKHAAEFLQRYKGVKEEVELEETEGKVYSVHVKGDSAQHNSPEFKKHLAGWGGEKHYTSDKGAAYKFKKEYQATGFHHGVGSMFKKLDSEHDGLVKEEADSKKYPRKGFPEPGDYGYHPNPGLKPQESDKDEDMDVAYKKATEKEGRKPLNAKITEALTRVTSGNKGYGYHGNVEARDDAEKDKRYSAMHRYAKKLVGDAGHLQDAKKPNVMVKHFLDSAHGRHIADNPTDKNITSRFSEFKKSYKPEMHEEVELDELSRVDHGSMKKAAPYQPSAAYQTARNANPYAKRAQDAKRERDARSDAIAQKQRKKAEELRSGYKSVKEELGKSNEWGTDALRQKYAAATPGQEGLTAKKIPSFDPRYDDVTTQHLGLHPFREGYLAEISARGAEARAKFQAKVRQTLADPANIKRAKKTLAKKKEVEKAKEAPHLVMQLRKAVSIGSKVHFQDGSHHAISGNHADIFMSKYNSAKSSIEKEALQKRAHKSHSEFMRTIAEGVHENCGTPDCCQMCDTAEMGTHHVDSYEAHRGSGDQISPVISHDDEDIRFQDFDETAFEKELEADVLALSWDDLVDLYDEDEIEYEESPEAEEEGEDLEEGITPAGRLKKKFNAMRTKSRRNMARNIAIKRVSSPEKLKARSIRAARRMVYKRLLRNRDISTVSSSEKTRLEAQIKRMAPMVARLSVRVMPAVRKLEQSRIKNSRTRKRK